LLRKSKQEPIIGYTSIAQEGIVASLSGPRSPLQKIMFQDKTEESRRKDYPKKMKKNLSITFFLFSGEFFF